MHYYLDMEQFQAIKHWGVPFLLLQFAVSFEVP